MPDEIRIEHEHEAAGAAGAAATNPAAAREIAEEISDAFEEAREERELRATVENTADTANRALEQAFAASSHGHAELEGRLGGIETQLSEALESLARLQPRETAEHVGEAAQETVATAIEPVAEVTTAVAEPAEPEREHHSSPKRRGLRRGRR